MTINLKKYLITHQQHQQIKRLNTTSKEENKIIIGDIKNNRDKIFEQDHFNQFVIKQGYKRGDLNDTVKMLLNFNEIIQLDLT